jgi:hypothetical protein
MRWAAEVTMLATLLAAPLAHAQSCHAGTVGEDEIVWRSTIVGPLREPIPRSLDVERIHGGAIVDGQIVATHRTVEIVSRQPIGDHLTPPLARGGQRITLDGADRLTFAPRALERRVGHHASIGMSEANIRWLDDACGRANGVRIYVEQASYADLEGEIGRGDDHRRPFLLVGIALLVVLAALGALAYRRFTRAAELEDAEAAIEERFRAIE